MVDECNQVLALWDGKSRGTKHAIDCAKRQGKPIKVVRYTEGMFFN